MPLSNKQKKWLSAHKEAFGMLGAGAAALGASYGLGRYALPSIANKEIQFGAKFRLAKEAFTEKNKALRGLQKQYRESKRFKNYAEQAALTPVKSGFVGGAMNAGEGGIKTEIGRYSRAAGRYKQLRDIYEQEAIKKGVLHKYGVRAQFGLKGFGAFSLGGGGATLKSGLAEQLGLKKRRNREVG